MVGTTADIDGGDWLSVVDGLAAVISSVPIVATCANNCSSSS
jgi:hypothetical protein